MLLAVVSDPRLVLARLAEQLVGLRHARSLPAADRERLAVEARAVFAPLANRLGVWQLKWELEDLAFRYLDADEYRRIAAALNERRADRERYIEGLCSSLQAELRKAGIEPEVYGRPKHMYSIYRKMQRKQLEFDQLFDVRAMRVVVSSVPECYAALGVVHGLWHYIPGEFDDYIATPKGNFYRSIHTAVIGPGGKSVEVQIRTREMHEHAELGVAAHWTYKEGGSRDSQYERKIEWVRKLLEPQDTSTEQNDRDFLERMRTELFEDRVYALTPKGEVIDLPRGATPLDFAYQIHTSLGHRCKGGKVNGRIVPLTYTLHNGEVVEIIAGKQEAPSRDWLAPEQGYLG
jgi:GTP pyrophosphokinase